MLLPQIVLRASQPHSTSSLRIRLPKTYASVLHQPKKNSFSKRTVEKTTSSDGARNEPLKATIIA